MKNLFSFCTSTIFFLYSLVAQTPLSDGFIYEKNISESEAKIAKANNKFQEFHNLNTSNYDVKYYRLAVEINPNINFISGNVTNYFVPTEDAGMSEIKLDCAEALQVDSAKYHGNNVTFSVVIDEQRTFYFPNTITKGNLDSLTIFYHGTPVSTGFGSFYKGVHGANSAPIVWTFSVPYGAKDWWICKNTLDDKADSLDLFVKTLSQYKAVGNGKLVEILPDADGISHSFHWKHRYPITSYLVATSVTNYSSYSDYLVSPNNDSLEILNFVYPENLTAAKQGTIALLPVIQFYESKFGKYPFRKEKFGHAQFGWGGGMEHQTMVFVTNFDKGLLAHELAHQWFGDAITCGTFRDVWLNEGFATYVTALADEPNSAITFKNWKASTINAITAQTNGSVYNPDTTDYNRIFDYRLTYQKGAMLLNMLRYKIGDSAFFAGMKAYMADTTLVYKYAQTINFHNQMTVTSGQNLAFFFQKWFYSEGYPKYDLRWAQTADAKIVVKLNQTTSHPSVIFYEMPVEIRFRNATRDTTVRFEHIFSGQIEYFNLGFTPTFVGFDPENNIVCKKTVTKDISLAASELEDEILLQIAPNPVANILKINVLENYIQKISLYDVSGKLMSQKGFDHAVEAAIDCSNLTSSATYFVEILLNNQKIIRKKIIKI